MKTFRLNSFEFLVLLIFILTTQVAYAQCCGNGICETGETPLNCPYDCGTSLFNCPNTIGSFFTSSTWPINSATAQSNGWCYTITGSFPQTVCFEYIVPPLPEEASVSFIISGCNTSSVNQNNTGGGCNVSNNTSSDVSGTATYNSNCNLITTGIQTGNGLCYTPGDIITVCVDLTGTCSPVTICPIIKCINVSCSILGSSPVCPPFNFVQSGTISPCDSTSGNALVTPSCGSHFTYLWDDPLAQTDSNATGLTSGTYNVTITNTVFNCDTIITVVIPNSSSTVITQTTNSICQGDNILLGGGLQTTAGVYYDTLTTSIGCDSIVETTLSINALPVIIASIDDTICPGIASNISTSGGISYNWDNGLGAGQNHAVTPLTTTTYVVTGTDANGCQNSDTVIVNVELGTLANAGIDQELCDDILTFTLNGNILLIPGETGLWATTSSTVIANPNMPNSLGSGLTIGSHTFIWTITNATCPPSADSIVITVISCEPSSIIVPNVFTPNGDGSNDVFIVEGTNLVSVEGQIFNRWGQLMFSWNNVRGSWDGRTPASSEAPDGTYFYIIEALGGDGTEYFEKGGFSLIR